MRKIFILLLYVCSAVLPVLAADNDKPVIFILDFSSDSIDTSALTLYTETFREALFKTGHFTTVNRSEIDQAMKELKLQMSGACSTTKCFAEVGGAYGAEKFIVLSATKIGDFHKFQATLVDVATVINDNIVSKTYQGSEINRILAAIEELAYGIAGGSSAATTVQVAPKMEESKAVGSIEIATTPPGARIYLDARDEGLTPLGKKTVRAGKHDLAIIMEGYAPLNKIVLVAPNQQVKVEEFLMLQTGSLKLSANVPAKVSLDGEYKGTTPLTFDGLKIGRYKVKIEAEYYEPHEESVNVLYNQTTERRFDLTAEPVPLLVTSQPDGATVKIDGEIAGTTPYRAGLPPGEHSVSVVAEGYRDSEQSVELEPGGGKTLALVLTPEAAAADLTVTSNPPGATVKLDGQVVGATPLDIAELEDGDHTVILLKDGYEKKTAVVEKFPGRPLNLDYDLVETSASGWYWALGVVGAGAMAVLALVMMNRSSDDRATRTVSGVPSDDNAGNTTSSDDEVGAVVVTVPGLP